MFNILIISLWLDAAQGVTFSVIFERPQPVAENAPENTIVTNITVVVPDNSSLVGKPAIVNANPIVHPFVITPQDTNRWQLMTTACPEVDFETISRYTLPILVRDDKGNSASQTILVQIADVNEPPFFTGALAPLGQGPDIYIAEGTLPHSMIFIARAEDPEKARLKFSIEISPNRTVFEVDDDTGAIFTTESFTFGHSGNSYLVTVKVTDPEGLFMIRWLKVFRIQEKYGDHVLTCTLFSIEKGRLSSKTENSSSEAAVNITLDEELPIGMTVGRCHVGEKYLINDITFHLDPSSRHFMIDRTHGTLLITSRLDMEEDGFISVHPFTVKACNKDLRCSAIPVITNVRGINDNQPYCDEYVYRYISKEVIANNTVVANIRCHDRDNPPDVLHYESNSGLVGAGKLSEQVPGSKNAVWITQDLDYEDPHNLAVSGIYEMTISVFDDAKPSHTVTATIIVKILPVNDFTPKFDKANYVFFVPETAKAHHVVGKVTATDDDYPSNCVTYRIVKGDIYPISIFWINPISGTIELVTHPDYESVQQYNLTIGAVDCNLVQPRTAFALVTINIEEENDEAPVCQPPAYRATIFDNVLPGTNINTFNLICYDRDSVDTSMRFEIVSGNEDNHFGFDPTRGFSSPKLIVKTPFDIDSGPDFQNEYHLVVHIIDDNLYKTTISTRKTGTVLIDITVVRKKTPSPTPPHSEQKKGLTIVYKSVNTFSSTDWYIPFIIALMAIMSVGLVAWWFYLIWRYANCKKICLKQQDKPPRAINKMETYKPGTQKERMEMITEVTHYETVFDGEAKDPVTGNLYEYNSKSGARKWKAHQEPEEENIFSVSKALL